MDILSSETQAEILARAPRATERVLPLPLFLDAHVVVLLHLVLQDQADRPVLLDASGVRRICPVAALLLATVLRKRAAEGAPVRIRKLPYDVRRQLERHPLGEYVAVEPEARSRTAPHAP